MSERDLRSDFLSLPSRRSFLTRTALSAAFLYARPRLLAAPPPPASAGCQFRAGPLFSPALEKFIAKLPAGRDEFVCEKYAEEIGALLSELSSSLRSSPR